MEFLRLYLFKQKTQEKSFSNLVSEFIDYHLGCPIALLSLLNNVFLLRRFWLFINSNQKGLFEVLNALCPVFHFTFFLPTQVRAGTQATQTLLEVLPSL